MIVLPESRPSLDQAEPETPIRSSRLTLSQRLRRRGQRSLRLLRFVADRFGEDHLAQAASSLTFTTVLSLVPLLAVIFALFTAFPLFAQFRLALDEFMVNSLMPAAVAETVMNYLSQFALQATRLSALGGLFLLATAITLILTIDKTFNDIWHVTRQRSLVQRMLVYWAVLSLGPVVLGASLWTTSFLARESLGLVADLSAAAGFALTFLPMVVTGLSITVMFLVVPNRYVAWRDAALGGFGAAIVLELMKTGLAWYVTRFPTYTTVYGTFAILPIFLLWLYLSWLVVLFGATVAASLPLIRLGRYDANRAPGAAFIDALGVLRSLARARGTVPPGLSTRNLHRKLQLNHDELASVLETLAAIGYVARLGEGAKERWALVCDPHTATLGPIFDRFLLDRKQPMLANDKSLQNIVYNAWLELDQGQAPSLSSLFEPGEPGCHARAKMTTGHG